MDGKDTSFSKKQELVLNNPFTIHNNTPKWPDGLASYSLGVKHQRITEVRGSEHVIFLIPGLTNWCMCYSRTEDDISDKNHELTAIHGINNDEQDLLKFHVKQRSNVDPALILYDTADKVVEWRPVSIGLRLYCANTDRENDGWLECCRVPHGHIREFFGIATIRQDQDYLTKHVAPYNLYHLQNPHMGYRVANGMIVPADNYITNLTTNAASPYSFKLSSIPGYATLPFKDVADYQFLLNPNKHYNEFQTIRNFQVNHATDAAWTQTTDNAYHYWNDVIKQYSVLMYGDPAVPDAFYKHFYKVNTLENTVTTVLNHQFLSDSLTHSSFDTIIIRVHTQPNTRMVIHTAANYEYLTTNEVQTGVSVTYADLDLVKRYIENRNAFHKLPFDSKSLHPDTKY